MNKITNYFIKNKYLILSIMIMLTFLSTFFFTKVKINEDMLTYIPNNIESAQGINIINDNFFDPKTVNLLLKNVTEETKEFILNEIEEVNIDVINTEVFYLKKRIG